MFQFKHLYLLVLLIFSQLTACGGKEARMQEHFEKGKTFFENADYDKARIEFQNALQIKPKFTNAQYYLGRVLEAKGNVRSAVGYYRNVVESDASNVDARVRLARIYLLGGAPDMALDLADQAMTLAPENADALVVRAGVHAAKSEFEDAIKLGKTALLHHSENADARMLLASIYVQQKKPDDAIAILEEGLKQNPKQLALRSTITRVFAQTNQNDKAIESLQQTVSLMPDNLNLRMQLASYHAKLKQIDDGEKAMREGVQANPADTSFKLALAEYLSTYRTREQAAQQLLSDINQDSKNMALQFGLASVYEKDKTLDKAIAVYRHIIEQENVSANGLKARNKLAVIFTKEKTPEKAKRLIAEVVKENPRDNDALMLRGAIALAENNASDAIADFRSVLKEQPSSTSVLKLLARAYIQNQDVALAKDSLLKAVSADPEDVETRLALSDLLIRENKTEDALVQLGDAIKLQPNNLQALEAMMRVQLQNKSLEGAVDTVAMVKAQFPGKAIGYYFAGLLAQKQGKFNEAANQLSQAISREPGAGEPLSALAKLYVDNNQSNKALQKIDAVIKSTQDNVIAYNLKGEVLMSQKKIAEARQAFGKAISLNASFVVAHRNLATSYLLSGDENGAIKAYSHGLESTNYNNMLVVGLAGLYEQHDKIDDAITLYKTALDKDASQEIYANNLAMLIASYKKDAESVELARKLVERFKQTKNPAYLDTVGWVYYRAGDYASAVSVLEKASQTAKNQPLLQYHLGMALYGKGDSVTAKHNLELAVSSNKVYPGKDEAKATLEKLAGL